MRRALGTAVMWGMIGVTIVGLFLTPVFYVAIRKTSGWFRTRMKRRAVADARGA